MKTSNLRPLTDVAEIHDYLREPISSALRSKREGKYPYYGATGQIGWIDDFRQDGDYVLLGEDGAPFLDPYKAKAYLVSGECWVNNHAHVLRGKGGICDNEYLCHALNWADYTNAVTGSTRLKLPQSTMHRILIPTPPIGLQRRIATRLREQLAELETAQKAIEQQQRDAKRLFESLHKEASTFLSEMKVTPLGGLLSGIEAGKSFRTSERIAQDNEMGVLKVSAVSWTEFRPNEAKAIDHAYVPQHNHRVRKGDLLISRANTVELVGAVVQADRDYPNRLLSDKTLRLIPDTARILPDFLLRVLRLTEARAYIENNATGTSDSMRNISQKTILATPIRLPDLPIQQSLVQRFLAIENESKRINTAFKAISENLAILPSKLLSAAFEI
jgi:type I restriction enzyme S subunit